MSNFSSYLQAHMMLKLEYTVPMSYPHFFLLQSNYEIGDKEFFYYVFLSGNLNNYAIQAW